MAEVSEYKCPSCGAPMRFDINEQRMVCTLCSNSYDFEYIRSHFNEVSDKKLSDFEWVERTKYVWEPNILEQLAEYTCSSCGGNIITKNTSASARCPFCNHEVVVSSNFAGDLRPDKVIPFRRKAEEFAEKYRQNIAGSVYAPDEFKASSVTDGIVGCYIPIWVYSCTCDSVGGTSDSVRFRIKDFPILGTDIKKDIFYSVAPFQFDDAEDFTESCLTGFYAGRYSIGAENAMNHADEEVKQVCSARAALAAGGDYIPGMAVKERVISDKKLTYYLVPIWFLNVAYKGQKYTFAMNGQTGEFASPDVPFNYKAKLYGLLIFVFLMAVTFILCYFFVKEDYMSVPIALLITTVFSLFGASSFVFIASAIINYKISKKLRGGLRNAKSYSATGIKNYIDGDVKINGLNSK